MKRLVVILGLMVCVLSINAQAKIIGTASDTIFAAASDNYASKLHSYRYDAAFQVNYEVVTDSAKLTIIRQKSMDGVNYSNVDTTSVAVAASGSVIIDADFNAEFYQRLNIANAAVGDTVLITVLLGEKRL